MELRVNKCCCMSLRTGGLVIGWLWLIAVILNSIMIWGTRNITGPNRAYASLALQLLEAVSSGIMIYGIKQKKHRMLLPWLIIEGTVVVVLAPMSIILTVQAYISDNPDLMASGLILLSLVGFCCWFWVVIFSLYKEIQESTKQPLTIYENSSLENMPVPPYQELENKLYGPANV